MKKIIIPVIIIVAGLVTWYGFQGGESTEQYLSRLARERVEKDQFFRESGESPFVEHDLEFNGLSYFPPNPDYKVTARLIPIEGKRIVTMGTNDNKTKDYREFAIAEFELHEMVNQLTLYEIPVGPFKGKLFLPFADATSALETYGGGRYLDVDKPSGNSLVLDFNMAYNPYCAYTEGYSCPLPPPSNILEVPIKAGEKNYGNE